MRNVSDKSCRENQNTHFKFSNISFPRKLYRLKDNVEEYCGAREATDENKIRRMCFAWWITKATSTHPKYEILVAFSRQQRVMRTDLNTMHYVQCSSHWVAQNRHTPIKF
jgi:hypothetical protein